MSLVKRILATSLVILFTFGSLATTFPSTAKADTFQVEFDNKTSETVKITLTGPATFSFSLEPGKTKANIPGGNYSYSYHACGKPYSGKFLVNSVGDDLRIARCTGGGSVGQTGNAFFQIVNGTKETITISFSGPESYTFAAKPGKSKVEVEPGTYTFTYYACEKSINGTIRVKAAERGKEINIPACDAPDTASSGNAVKFLIENNTGGYLYLTLSGPQTYNLSIPPGKTRVEIVPGKYTFTARGTGCGGIEDEGKVNVRAGYYWRWFCN